MRLSGAGSQRAGRSDSATSCPSGLVQLPITAPTALCSCTCLILVLCLPCFSLFLPVSPSLCLAPSLSITSILSSAASSVFPYLSQPVSIRFTLSMSLSGLPVTYILYFLFLSLTLPVILPNVYQSHLFPSMFLSNLCLSPSWSLSGPLQSLLVPSPSLSVYLCYIQSISPPPFSYLSSPLLYLPWSLSPSMICLASPCPQSWLFLTPWFWSLYLLFFLSLSLYISGKALSFFFLRPPACP